MRAGARTSLPPQLLAENVELVTTQTLFEGAVVEEHPCVEGARFVLAETNLTKSTVLLVNHNCSFLPTYRSRRQETVIY